MAGAWTYVPAAHMTFYNVAQGAYGCIFVAAYEGMKYGSGFCDELSGAGGMVESGVRFLV